MKISRAASMVLLLFIVPAIRSQAAEPFIDKTDLFKVGNEGYKLYHIPGIVVTSKGSVLAYCEARKHGGDWDQIDVLLRRSTDNGKTWDAPRHVAHLGDPVPRNPLVLARKLGNPTDQTVNN